MLNICNAGGNNGVKSVINSWGTDEFRRLRVGVGKPKRGTLSREEFHNKMRLHVLQAPPPQELEILSGLLEDGGLQAELVGCPGGGKHK
jgi:peptidyl-tRNA hydrolase